MKKLLVLLAALLLPTSAMAVTPVRAPPKTPQTAIFAGGCFWCMEHDMQGIPGVISVQSGYTGGHVKNPTYRDVTGEKSGHYEAVKVTFDPQRLPYGYLLERYWKLVDPTDDGGQFCDRGPSYRPAVFVNSPAQRKAAEVSRAEAAKKIKRGQMKTPILDAGTFWPAEAYHRDYAKNNAAQYNRYRQGCGRDGRLAYVWGK